MAKTARTLTALAGAALLAACSGSDAPPEPPVESNAIETVPVEPAPELLPIAPPPVVNTVDAPAEDVVEPDPDQQVLDDADATGMTARVDRGETAPGEAETQPVR